MLRPQVSEGILPAWTDFLLLCPHLHTYHQASTFTVSVLRFQPPFWDAGIRRIEALCLRMGVNLDDGEVHGSYCIAKRQGLANPACKFGRSKGDENGAIEPTTLTSHEIPPASMH